MTTIYIDIETLPSQAPFVISELRKQLKPPATLKKPESIAAWWKDESEAALNEAWLKTALDGTYGQLACIGWAVDDEPPQGLIVDSTSANDERAVLSQFWGAMTKLTTYNSGTRPVVVGHNHVGFDLPFLWRRSVVNICKPPMWWPRNPKPWSEHCVDTMLIWAGDRGTIGLDRLCVALGLEGKADGMTGADVWPAWQAGKQAEILEYCLADVERTRAVHRRMMFA